MRSRQTPVLTRWGQGALLVAFLHSRFPGSSNSLPPSQSTHFVMLTPLKRNMNRETEK